MVTHLRVIRSSGGEQSVQRVVGRDDETRQVNQELAGDVEENEEEVDSDQAEDHVDLGDGGLTLQVVEDGVLGQLDDTAEWCKRFANSEESERFLQQNKEEPARENPPILMSQALEKSTEMQKSICQVFLT